VLGFRPAIFSAFQGYRRADFFGDLSAGLTVGIIALPLAIGFGIASGVTPQQGLWTGIIAGLAVALLGGSRFQIAGPTGAFVPVLFATVANYGYGGLVVATIMAGVMLVVLGALKMGRLLKFFPYPVVAGFTSGIAVIIFCGQLDEFLGLGLKMPEHVPQQIALLAGHLASVNWYAAAIGALSVAIVYLWPRMSRRVPGSIVAVGAAALVAYFGHLPVATIGSNFGGIATGFPRWHFPDISLETMRQLMGPAFTIAALGAIESLLSAMVADGMAETRHDPNQELIGQVSLIFSRRWLGALRGPRSDFAVMVTAFALTVLFDLTVGVAAGMFMAMVLFLRQMEAVSHIRLVTPESEPESPGTNSMHGKKIPEGVVLYRIEGPLFFAAAENLDQALRGSGRKPKIVIFRMRNVPAMDASGLHAFRVAIQKLHRDGVKVFLTAVQPQPMKVMFESGLVNWLGENKFCADLDQALAACKQALGTPS